MIDKNFPHEQTQIIKEEKIQYKYIDKPVVKDDNVRLAHELLFGLGIWIYNFCLFTKKIFLNQNFYEISLYSGRPQEISQAITFYYEEAEKNHNVFACNALGQIYFEGVFVPKDVNKVYI